MSRLVLCGIFLLAFCLPSAHAEPGPSRLRIGTLVGAVTGFGIGHVVQGRYDEGAWATLTQFSALMMIGLGMSDCPESAARLLHPSFSGTGGCKLITAGSGLYVGSRLVELIDLLEHTPFVDRRSAQPELQGHLFPIRHGVAFMLEGAF